MIAFTSLHEQQMFVFLFFIFSSFCFFSCCCSCCLYVVLGWLVLGLGSLFGLGRCWLVLLVQESAAPTQRGSVMMSTCAGGAPTGRLVRSGCASVSLLSHTATPISPTAELTLFVVLSCDGRL